MDPALFEANQARLKMGVLAYNLLHMLRQFYVWGEEVRRSIEWLIKRLIKVGARVSYHARRWHVHVASAFPLAHHWRAVLDWASTCFGYLLIKSATKGSLKRRFRSWLGSCRIISV
ncbi:MAG: transposase [Nitrospinae bacterium]|nr:transposase [Nitrospinota bacterium]